MKEPLISVIMPAYNEKDYVAEALKSVKRQSYDRTETIVVANSCTDDTAKVAREFATRVIETTEQGISLAKNLGFQNSNGGICSFMDADSEMGDGLLEKVHNAYNKGYECGKAKIRPSDDKRLRAKVFCLFSESLNRLTSPIPWIDGGSGGFTFLTRDLADKMIEQDGELYNTDLHVMEDLDIGRRMKKLGKYKFITDSCLFTSMRRFIEEGYLKCFFQDTFHVLFPKGKTRKRWNNVGSLK
jgi:glycosyltransferase involved in cell wall biosynthesis